MMSGKVQDTLGFGDHGSTFGGNPVCCAAALSVLSRIDEELLSQVRKKSEFLISSLSAMPGVKEVTGLGLMLGVRTEKPAGEVLAACRERGLLCLTAKDKVRLLPALNIPMDLLQKSVEIFREVLS